MTRKFTTTSLQDLFSFPFKDPDWKNKFLIGSLISLAGYIIPIIPFLIVYGYGAEIMRRITVRHEAPSLPEWDDWSKYLIDGLRLFGLGFVYMLPVILLFVGGYALMLAGIFIPGLAAETAGADSDAVGALMGLGSIAGTVGFIALFGVGMVLTLGLSFLLPAAANHLIAKDEFAAGFRFKEWWPIFRANIAGFLISYLILMAVGMVLGFAVQIVYLTIICCCLVPFLSAPITMYIVTVGSAMLAQAYQEGESNLHAKITPHPDNSTD